MFIFPCRSEGASLAPHMLQKEANGEEFCIAVAAHPTGRINVQGEADMVRSCILYADRIRLYSPTASLVLQVGSAVRNMTRSEAVELMIEVMNHTGSTLDAETAGAFRQAARNSSETSWTRRAKQQRSLKNRVDAAVAGMATTAVGWSSTPAFMDLKLAEKHGILSFVRESALSSPVEQVADFIIAASMGMPRQSAFERDNGYKRRMLAELLRSMTSEFEYPLLDRGVRDLVRSGNVSMQEVPLARARSKAIGLGTNIFSRLPVPQAPMDELLDLRQELSGVVSRFRRGLLEASAEIESAQWDESFQSEASYIYDRNIAPALEELEDLLQSTPALQKFFSFSSSVAKSLASVGSLYLIADKLLHVGPEIGVALGLSVAATNFVFEQIIASKSPMQKARDNDWFLVYQAKASLESM